MTHDDLLDRLALGGTTNIDAVLTAFMAKMGGVDNFAAEMVADYRALTPGAPLRQRIAAKVLDLMEKRSDSTPELDNLDELQELERRLAQSGNEDG